MKMRLAYTITLLVGTLLIGCTASPAPQATGGVSVSKYQNLQAENNRLQFNYDSLKKSCDESRNWHEKYNALVDETRVNQVENAALKGQVQSLTSQYQAALNALSGNQAVGLKELEAMNKKLEQAKEWTRTIDKQLEKVRDKKVQLLSDNLTEAEYKAFYKGWELWWGTFND